jgi:hypothetical protein
VQRHPQAGPAGRRVGVGPQGVDEPVGGGGPALGDQCHHQPGDAGPHWTTVAVAGRADRDPHLGAEEPDPGTWRRGRGAGASPLQLGEQGDLPEDALVAWGQADDGVLLPAVGGVVATGPAGREPGP